MKLVIDCLVSNCYSEFMPRPREFDIDVVLTQSMNVFWAQGFKATSMEDLMKATRLNKQSFYCAFGDKHSLFVKSLALYRQQSLDKLTEVLSDENAPFEAIKNFGRDCMAPCGVDDGPDGCLMINTCLEFGETDPAVASEIRQMFQGFEKRLGDAVARAQKKGEITSRFDSRLIAKSLINTIGGLRIMEKRGESRESLEAVLELAFDSFAACKPG